ncbi:MAG TPA: DUF1573 domain-containing protein [Sediminibacterium sp.]|nr:DUF1573 domain-containing protein [Sediminibacterium sp.]
MSTYKKIIYAGILLIGSWVGGMHHLQAQQPGKLTDSSAWIHIVPLDYDMGTIPAHHPVEYPVQILNKGKDTLVLEAVHAGCGCTSPKYRTHDKIPPGASTRIFLGFNGDAAGDFVKTADLVFAGGFTRQVRFHGKALVDSSAAPRTVPVYR